MAIPSSIQFIDNALSPTSIFQLSYTDYAQKQIIRTHLVSFLHGYPSFSPSIDNFTHDDGRTVMLLLARGDLSVCDSSPPITIAIWLHENYPYEPPIVFVSPPSAASPITHDHPFVQPSGFIDPYLLEWKYPSSNVSNLVRTLAELFTLYYPFVLSYDGFGLHPPSAMDGFSDSFDDVEPGARADQDLIEQLSEDLLYHMVALTSKTQQETDDLMKIQKELLNRKRRSENLIKGYEHEKSVWEEKVNGIDALMNWVKANDPIYFAGNGNGNGKDESFDGAEDISKLVIECLAADNAIEDVIYALGKTVEEGEMSFKFYMKMVRRLGREQFIHRATLRKINRLHLLDWAHSSHP